MIKREKMQNYSDLFFYFQFDDDYSCKHRFLNHALVYVYGGELEMTDSDRAITVKTGQAAFVSKDSCMQMEICLEKKEDARIAILRIPESFLREFYFTVERLENVLSIPDRSSPGRCRQFVPFDATILRNRYHSRGESSETEDY